MSLSTIVADVVVVEDKRNVRHHNWVMRLFAVGKFGKMNVDLKNK